MLLFGTCTVNGMSLLLNSISNKPRVSTIPRPQSRFLPCFLPSLLVVCGIIGALATDPGNHPTIIDPSNPGQCKRKMQPNHQRVCKYIKSDHITFVPRPDRPAEIRPNPEPGVVVCAIPPNSRLEANTLCGKWVEREWRQSTYSNDPPFWGSWIHDINDGSDNNNLGNEMYAGAGWGFIENAAGATAGTPVPTHDMCTYIVGTDSGVYWHVRQTELQRSFRPTQRVQLLTDDGAFYATRKYGSVLNIISRPGERERYYQILLDGEDFDERCTPNVPARRLTVAGGDYLSEQPLVFPSDQLGADHEPIDGFHFSLPVENHGLPTQVVCITERRSNDQVSNAHKQRCGWTGWDTVSFFF